MDDPFKAEVDQIFAPLSISVVSNHHYLGGFLGESASWDAFVQDKAHK